MSRATRRHVEDFARVFEVISSEMNSQVVLVGGHAVNVWALTYQDRLVQQLRLHHPLTSSDLDFYATRNALIHLADKLGGKLFLSGPREVTEGTVVIGAEPETREIDILRSVHGLPTVHADDSIHLKVCGHAVPVLFPHLLLQAKLENAMHLNQSNRQDVKHVKVLALVLREFLRDVVTTASSGNERPALKLLQRTVQILTSPKAKEFERRYQHSLGDILPIEALSKTELPKLRAFWAGELPHRLGLDDSANQVSTPLKSNRRKQK